MAWLYKRGGKWWMGWMINGKQFLRPTGEREKERAEAKLSEIERLSDAHKSSALTEQFYAAATGRKIEKVTAANFFAGWLAESENETVKSTMHKYRQVVREFSAHIEADAKGLMLEDITVGQVSSFFATSRARLSSGTVKGYRRILSSIFLLAQNRGLIKANPVALAKGRGKAAPGDIIRKRPFTSAELKTLHAAATPFWKYMIAAGYFTGQSLGDLATMRAETVSLSSGMITMHRRKTGKQVIIPLSNTLRAMLIEVWPADGKGCFWPKEAERYLRVKASPFSQEFYEMLAAAGMVSARDEKKKGGKNGRSARREPQKLGFHNIRHTFITQLKVGGAMDSVAKELAGHGSDAVSAVYTHLPAETLTHAIKQLPEFV